MVVGRMDGMHDCMIATMMWDVTAAVYVALTVETRTQGTFGAFLFPRTNQQVHDACMDWGNPQPPSAPAHIYSTHQILGQPACIEHNTDS